MPACSYIFADRYSAHVVTGFVQTPTAAREKINERLALCLGNSIEDIEAILHREGVDTVILADREIPQRDLLRLAANLRAGACRL